MGKIAVLITDMFEDSEYVKSTEAVWQVEHRQEMTTKGRIESTWPRRLKP